MCVFRQFQLVSESFQVVSARFWVVSDRFIWLASSDFKSLPVVSCFCKYDKCEQIFQNQIYSSVSVAHICNKVVWFCGHYYCIAKRFLAICIKIKVPFHRKKIAFDRKVGRKDTKSRDLWTIVNNYLHISSIIKKFYKKARYIKNIKYSVK